MHRIATNEICSMKHLKIFKQTRMKTIFFSAAFALISVCFSLRTAAQNDLGIDEEHMPDLSRPVVIADIPVSFLKDSTVNINQRAARILQKRFPGVHQTSWYEAPNGIIASFDSDATKTKVYFDKKGRLNYSIRYYDENMLPKNVRHVIRSTYYDDSILSIAEIHPTNTNGQKTYIILTEDAKTLKRLIANDTEIISVKSYSKA